MFLMDVNRKVVVLAVAAALSLGGPLAAAERAKPGIREDSAALPGGGIFPRFLVWLGITPAPEAVKKSVFGGVIDLLETLHTAVTNNPPTDRGASIDPNGNH